MTIGQKSRLEITHMDPCICTVFDTLLYSKRFVISPFVLFVWLGI